MKRLAAATILTAGLLRAAAPTDAEMQQALRYAESQWGVRVTSPITLEAAPLNACVLGRDTYAITEVRWSQSVLTDESGTILSAAPPAADSYRYAIRINSACKWNRTLLEDVMTHELGHALIGADYHSLDPKSAMYRLTFGAHKQHIKQADRSRIVDHGAIEPIRMASK